jgi:hypothetical protein
MKSVRVVVLTPEAADVYHNFLSKASDSKQEDAILNAFLQKVELLKDNVHYGQPIAKKHPCRIQDKIWNYKSV